jgi:hypothetical protein
MRISSCFRALDPYDVVNTPQIERALRAPGELKSEL